MIEVRTDTASMHHQGVELIAADTRILLSTSWFTLAGGYRRPSRVVTGDGASILVRDYSMIVRLAALVLAMLLAKGMKR